MPVELRHVNRWNGRILLLNMIQMIKISQDRNQDCFNRLVSEALTAPLHLTRSELERFNLL